MAYKPSVANKNILQKKKNGKRNAAIIEVLGGKKKGFMTLHCSP